MSGSTSHRLARGPCRLGGLCGCGRDGDRRLGGAGRSASAPGVRPDPPMTVSGFVLDWYASLPGVVGGACFRQARRVPRLDRASLALRCHPEEQYPEAVALLDPRFWCLPDSRMPPIPTPTWWPPRPPSRPCSAAQCGLVPTTSWPAMPVARSWPGGICWGASSTASTPASGTAGVPRCRRRQGAAARGAGAAGVDLEFADPSTVYRLTDARGREHLVAAGSAAATTTR